jgi:type II secretory pathway component PulF
VAATWVLAALVVQLIVSFWAVPIMQDHYETIGMALPAPTQILLSWADVIRSFWFIAVPLHLAAAGGLCWFCPERCRPAIDCALIVASLIGMCILILGLVMPFTAIASG